MYEYFKIPGWAAAQVAYDECTKLLHAVECPRHACDITQPCDMGYRDAPGMPEFGDRKSTLPHPSMLVGPCACSIFSESRQCIGDHSKEMNVREGQFNEMSREHEEGQTTHSWNWNGKSLQILCANVDGLPNKIDELHLRVEDSEPDVVVLTECIPKAQMRELTHSCFTVGEYYTPYLNFDPNQAGLGVSGRRGIVILVRSGLSPTEISFPGIFQESLWLKMKLANHDSLLIGAVYRSPSSDGHQSTDALCQLLETVGILQQADQHCHHGRF